MRDNALIRLQYHHSLTHVHVKGLMQLEKSTMPFQYKVPISHEEFDHAAKLDDIEARGRVWETRLAEFWSWRGWEGELGGAQVKVLDCTIYGKTPDNWRLICVFHSGGQDHRIDLTYAHPGQALSLDQLKEKVAEIVGAHHEKLRLGKTHMEGLSVLADLAKATALRSSGGG